MTRPLGILAALVLLLAGAVWATLDPDLAPAPADPGTAPANATDRQRPSTPGAAAAAPAPGRVEPPRAAAPAAAAPVPESPAEGAQARLAVVDADGHPVAAYRVQLRHHLPGAPGDQVRVPDFRRDITPEDCALRDGRAWVSLRELPTGSFRFEVLERAHADSLSDPVLLRRDRATPEVVVRLTRGATLTGTVVDELGEPVPGAIVCTDADGAAEVTDGSPAATAWRCPPRFSQAQASTDAKGHFCLSKLAFADYMIRIGHADYCQGQVRDLELGPHLRDVDVGTVRLLRGALVVGRTTVAGRPAARIRVTVSDRAVAVAPHQSGAIRAAERPRFSSSAVSDDRGEFRLIRRIPPGTFTAEAASCSAPPSFASFTPSGTRQTFAVAPGQRHVFLNFDLPAR